MMFKHNVLIALSAFGIAFMALLSSQTPVQADGGPHGGYQSTGTTDLCAACHRVHQGKSDSKLLKAESPYALCLTCHNGAGTVLNVLDGIKMSATQALSGITPRAVASKMAASMAPYGELWAMPGGTAVYTVRIRNTDAGGITPTLGCSPACVSITNPGAIGGGAVGYGTVTITAPAATATTTTTITVTEASGNATLVVTTKAENGVAGATLNGGGFRFVNGAAATSRHDANPADASLKPWGYGGTGVATYLSTATATNNTGGDQNAFGASSPLQCTSCHNPHGSTNYRLLKNSINGVSVRVRAYYSGFTNDEGARGLEVGAPANKYTQEYYGSTGDADANNTALTASATSYGIATLCGACHTAYPSANAGTSLTAPALSTITYAAQVGTFTVGETITGGTSGKTAAIVSDADGGTTGTLTLRAVSGAFSNPEVITGGTSGATANTSSLLTNPNQVHYRHATEKAITGRPGCGANGTCDGTQNPEETPLGGFSTLRLASNGTNANEYVTCLTCHRVHGTASTMSGYALKASQGGTGEEDLTPSQFTNSLSTLLYTNNRGMCEGCHRW